MTYKQLLLNDIKREVRLIKHLYTKIPDGQMGFRPKDGMRSIEELLEYLRRCSTGMTYYYVSEETDQEIRKAAFQHFRERAADHEDFLTAMDDQAAQIEQLLEGVSDDDLLHKKVNTFWGEQLPLGEALLHSSVKFFSAYRMQLFLYAKMAGADDINTVNNWVGVDYKPPEQG